MPTKLKQKQHLQNVISIKIGDSNKKKVRITKPRKIKLPERVTENAPQLTNPVFQRGNDMGYTNIMKQVYQLQEQQKIGDIVNKYATQMKALEDRINRQPQALNPILENIEHELKNENERLGMNYQVPQSVVESQKAIMRKIQGKNSDVPEIDLEVPISSSAAVSSSRSGVNATAASSPMKLSPSPFEEIPEPTLLNPYIDKTKSINRGYIYVFGKIGDNLIGISNAQTKTLYINLGEDWQPLNAKSSLYVPVKKLRDDQLITYTEAIVKPKNTSRTTNNSSKSKNKNL